MSIIGRKCYLFGTFQHNAPKLYSLVLVLIGNALPDLILCVENIFLKQQQYSILKSLLYYCERHDSCSEASVTIAANSDPLTRVSSHR